VEFVRLERVGKAEPVGIWDFELRIADLKSNTLVLLLLSDYRRMEYNLQSLLQNSSCDGLRRRRRLMPAQGCCNPGNSAVFKSIGETLKEFAKRPLANAFSVRVRLIDSIPGLPQPWAGIGQRLRRKGTSYERASNSDRV
jgi:hypothetical protein